MSTTGDGERATPGAEGASGSERAVPGAAGGEGTAPGAAGGEGAGKGPSEEELRAAYEAEIKKIRVEHILLEHVVTLVNLGMRRTGLQPGTEQERDVEQVRVAIDAIRALMPLLERTSAEHVGPIRDALSQLQLAFVRIGGGQAQAAPTGAASGGETPPKPEGEAQRPEQPRPGEPGPAQRSGRLWVPGQR